MRLLTIGHSYITPFAQAKYVAMKALHPDLAVRLVVPPVVRHPFGAYRPERSAKLLPEELVVIRSFGGRSNMTYMLDPIALASLMRRFGPTHVHIEEDPHSVVGAEAVWLASSLCPTAALSFFVWDNLNRMPAFPMGVMKRHLTRFAYSRTRLVICGNEEARSLLPVKGYRGASEVIPQMGLDSIPAPAEGRTKTIDRIPTIGYLGRLVEEKGVLDLLEVLSQLQAMPWKLVIAGNGPLRRDIEHRWQTLFGDRLTYLAAVSHEEVQTRLSSIDIFVLPSRTIPTWKEQFGLTLAQAMLAGCACIGSSSGAIPEVLGGNGIVVPERDVRALAAAIHRLLESPAERVRLGSAAHAFAGSRYTNEAVATRYLQAFAAAAN